MLRHLNSMLGHSVVGEDGEIGQVDGFHFDDAHWTVRYFVVDTDDTLPRPRLLVSPHALREPDWEGGKHAVNLTRGHVHGSPEGECDYDVPRHHEVACAQHFGWPEWWDQVAREGQAEREPILRSTQHNYGIDALNRYVGGVSDYIVDPETWAIRYLVVQTAGWDTHQWVLVAPSWITYAGQGNNTFTVGLRFEEMAHAPGWLPGTPVSREFEERLCGHYGRPGHWER